MKESQIDSWMKLYAEEENTMPYPMEAQPFCYSGSYQIVGKIETLRKAVVFYLRRTLRQASTDVRQYTIGMR